MRKELINMIDRFPAYRTKIQDLYLVNEDFRSLGEDYYLCREQLRQIKSQNPSDNLKEIECQQVCLELETELIKFLGLGS